MKVLLPKSLSRINAMMKQLGILLLFFLLRISLCNAQFAPAVGQTGTTAIHKDSAIIVSWSKACIINRGFQNIADTSLGITIVGDSTSAIGKAGESGVVSLGDAGYAVLTFEKPIINDKGYDFVVFENSFNDTYLELAFVEVSSDGVNFYRFQSISKNDTLAQFGNDAQMDPSKINNLAGKYRALFGTPFDLEELKNEAGLDINNITHIKIIDVVGSLINEYASYDAHGNKINDPWPTPFPSSGFDLDAVGVINQKRSVEIAEIVEEQSFSVFPNPVACGGMLNINGGISLEVFDAFGKSRAEFELSSNMIQLPYHLEKGIYLLRIQANSGFYSRKLIIQ